MMETLKVMERSYKKTATYGKREDDGDLSDDARSVVTASSGQYVVDDETAVRMY